MFKLTIHGDGLNFDMEINQTIAVSVIRAAMANKFGSIEREVPRPVIQVVQTASNPSSEQNQTKSIADPEESEPP